MLAAMVALALCAQQDAPEKWAVHEWGTFTSVSDGRGGSLRWRPFLETSDLPTFVDSIGGHGVRFPISHGKGGIVANIRMETPVIYFYADRDVLASVRVRFPKGQLTEWYPSVSSYGAGKTDAETAQLEWPPRELYWGTFRVLPHADAALPDEHKPSHYYAAREVDAAQVSVCTAEKTQHERFLFYRGVGEFDAPVTAALDAKGLTLVPSRNLGEAFVFERKGDLVGLRRVTLDAERHVERLAKGSSIEEVKRVLVERLVAAGLYPKEAAAMVKTWNDSWFEPGLRVLYLEPTAQIDELLPLEVKPTPRERVRVIVGRLEVFAPERVEPVRNAALDAMKLNGADAQRAALRKLLQREGRFLDPILAIAGLNDARAMLMSPLPDRETVATE